MRAHRPTLSASLLFLAGLTSAGFTPGPASVVPASDPRVEVMGRVHAAIDSGGGLRHISVGGGVEAAVANNTAAAALSTLFVSLPLLLYGLFILRKVVPTEGPGEVE